MSVAEYRWQVLSRAECSLCDAMLADLVKLLGDGANQVQVHDISDDVELQNKYGTRIPVLMIDGEFVCAYKLDHDRVRRYL